MRLMTLLLLSASLPGCLLATSLGEPAELALSEMMTFNDLQVTFHVVDGDSRCPVDVNCFTAGKATVVLHFESADAESVEQRVDVPPGGSVLTSFGDLDFEVELKPEAHSAEPAEDREYRVVLTARSKTP